MIKPDCIEAFLALAQDDASHSVADEPGCRQFDIVQLELQTTSSSNHVLFMRCMTAGRRSKPICKRRIWPGSGMASPRWSTRSVPSASGAVTIGDPAIAGGPP